MPIDWRQKIPDIDNDEIDDGDSAHLAIVEALRAIADELQEMNATAERRLFWDLDAQPKASIPFDRGPG